MANTRKVTVTLPEDIAATLEHWRDAGQIKSVSEYVVRQVQTGMDRGASLRAAESVHGGRSGPKRPPLEFINRGRALQGLAPLTEAEAEAISAEVWATAPGRSGAA